MLYCEVCAIKHELDDNPIYKRRLAECEFCGLIVRCIDILGTIPGVTIEDADWEINNQEKGVD